MSARTAVLLHNAAVEMQALITKRLAMVAANHAAECASQPIKYSETDFVALGQQMVANCWIDPTTVD